MTVYDTLTFYENLNMWKCKRTFHWDEYHVSPVNSSFSALNTYYDATNFDEFLYDNKRSFGLTNQITAQDYTIIRDFNGGNSLTTLGLFLTEIENGTQYIHLDEINWTTIYETGTPSLINIVPGNETDLYNVEGSNPETYTITMTFWEFLDDNIGIVNDYTAALSHVDSIYDGLMNPVDVSQGTQEDLFFNLDINCFKKTGFFLTDKYSYKIFSLLGIGKNIKRIPLCLNVSSQTFMICTIRSISFSGTSILAQAPRQKNIFVPALVWIIL